MWGAIFLLSIFGFSSLPCKTRGSAVEKEIKLAENLFGANFKFTHLANSHSSCVCLSFPAQMWISAWNPILRVVSF